MAKINPMPPMALLQSRFAYVHLGSFKAASDAEMAVNAFVEASRR